MAPLIIWTRLLKLLEQVAVFARVDAQELQKNGRSALNVILLPQLSQKIKYDIFSIKYIQLYGRWKPATGLLNKSWVAGMVQRFK